MNEIVKEMAKKSQFIFKDGFSFGKILQYKNAPKDAIYFKKTLTQEDINYINRNKINKVIIDIYQDEMIGLSLLNEIENLEYLTIYRLIDASLLDSLPKLKYLNINSRTPIALLKFPNLEWLSTCTPNQLVGIEGLKKIKSVSIYGRLELCGQGILDEVSRISTIDTLVLERTEMTDLSFIKTMPNLKVLILKENYRLKDLNALKNTKGSLRCLKIILSSKIESFSVISELDSLEFLYIDTCKSISSVSIITPLKNLKGAVIAKTDILDGNLSPLMNLEYGVAVPIKRKYFYSKNGKPSPIKIELFPYKDIDHGDSKIELWRQIDTW